MLLSAAKQEDDKFGSVRPSVHLQRAVGVITSLQVFVCNQWAYAGSCADFNDLLRPAFMTYATLRKKNKLGPVQFTRPTVSGLYDITRAKINGFYVIL